MSNNDQALAEWLSGLRDKGAASARCEGVQERAEVREQKRKSKAKPKAFESRDKGSDGLYVLLAVGLIGVLAYCAVNRSAPRTVSWIERNWRWAVACVLAAPWAALAARLYWQLFKMILA